jgi:hypothetical protein
LAGGSACPTKSIRFFMKFRGSFAARVQVIVDGVKGQFQAVRDAQLVEDVVQVVLHRLLADEHLLGHLFILETLGYQRHNLALALAQRRAFAITGRSGLRGGRRCFVIGHKLPDYGRRGMRIQPDLSRMHFANALDEQLGGGLLEYDSRRPELHRLHEFVLIVRSRQDDDTCLVLGDLQALQSGEPVEARHFQVEKQDVRFELL